MLDDAIRHQTSITRDAERECQGLGDCLFSSQTADPGGCPLSESEMGRTDSLAGALEPPNESLRTTPRQPA